MKLSENAAFITTAMRASEMAMRTHQREKIEALGNAIVNSQLKGAPEETIQQIYWNDVDDSTS